MTMNYEQWKRMLSAVDKEEGLSKDNVIDKIKEELKKYPEEYKKWEEAGFDVDYLFEIEDDTLIAYDRFMLLHSAAKNGHADVVNALIQNGANVNAEDNFKSTPLHNAARNGHIDTVKVLIAKGTDVNAKDQDGWTPLHLAAYKCHIDIVKVLLKKGADLLLKNNSGKTPRDLARTGDIKKLLEEEEKQLKKLNEEKNDLPQDKDDNKDTTPLLEETEKKQPTSAIKKGVFAGGAVAVLGTAVAVALFVTGTVAVELIPIVTAVVAIAAAALAVGGITYMMLKPSTKVEEVKEEQGPPNEQKIYAGYFM
ncbi:ankyrin repeat domain-containing protein [Wolbachia endosymbiont (group A) of Sympetrum striolatum]|uniref:ankyrin repeat domain-containing protein n=1 Tax=Wolbachia endosymbiont (group A) of Sympetrum striolatum TaxID=2954061 RepID=UPI00222698A4|nr:ankyrin repeat domain-containing protein [Wolbachia endosymbiont (group A) of Sympetrum striolatum]